MRFGFEIDVKTIKQNTHTRNQRPKTEDIQTPSQSKFADNKQFLLMIKNALERKREREREG